MKERSVQDEENVTWTCVQALSGLSGEAGEKAEQKIAQGGAVPVVCTPSGGAQTRRVELAEDWVDTLSDDQLLAKIKAAG